MILNMLYAATAYFMAGAAVDALKHSGPLGFVATLIWWEVLAHAVSSWSKQ